MLFHHKNTGKHIDNQLDKKCITCFLCFKLSWLLYLYRFLNKHLFNNTSFKIIPTKKPK